MTASTIATSTTTPRNSTLTPEFLTSARNESESALAQVHFSASILHASLGTLEKTDQAWRHALESVIDQTESTLAKLHATPRLNEYMVAQKVRQDAEEKLEHAKLLADKREWGSIAIGCALGALLTWIVCRGGAL